MRRWPFTNVRDRYEDCECRMRVRRYFGGDARGHKHDIRNEETMLDEHDDIRQGSRTFFAMLRTNGGF
jgi:hypothetical protein